MNDMREKIAKEYYLKWCGALDNDYERTAVYGEGLLLADRVLSLETKTHRIAVIKKGEPPILTPAEIGDNLDLDTEGRYLCSDGSIVWTVAVDSLIEAQRSSDIEYYKGD